MDPATAAVPGTDQGGEEPGRKEEEEEKTAAPLEKWSGEGAVGGRLRLRARRSGGESYWLLVVARRGRQPIGRRRETMV